MELAADRDKLEFEPGETHPIFPIKTLIKTDTKANIKHTKQSMDTEQLRMYNKHKIQKIQLNISYIRQIMSVHAD
jgi:hypothetical protein